MKKVLEITTAIDFETDDTLIQIIRCGNYDTYKEIIKTTTEDETSFKDEVIASLFENPNELLESYGYNLDYGEKSIANMNTTYLLVIDVQ